MIRRRKIPFTVVQSTWKPFSWVVTRLSLIFNSVHCASCSFLPDASILWCSFYANVWPERASSSTPQNNKWTLQHEGLKALLNNGEKGRCSRQKKAIRDQTLTRNTTLLSFNFQMTCNVFSVSTNTTEKLFMEKKKRRVFLARDVYPGMSRRYEELPLETSAVVSSDPLYITSSKHITDIWIIAKLNFEGWSVHES